MGSNGVELPGRVYTVAQIARAIGWPTQKARRWLGKLGALEKRGRLYVTTPEKLVEAFPEVYREMMLREPEGFDDL